MPNKYNNNTIYSKINETSQRLNSAYELGQKIFNKMKKNSSYTTDKSLLSSFDQNNINKNKSQINLAHININNYINNNNEKLDINKDNDSSSLHSSKSNVRQTMNSEYNDKHNINSIKKSKKDNYYIQKRLFPYKYYLYSVFVKNIDISKKSFFFTKKFVAVYNFICQLVDISSYLILQREFEVLKNTLIIREYKDLLESNRKINVNDESFIIDMKECLLAHKLTILGKMKNTKDISQ